MRRITGILLLLSLILLLVACGTKDDTQTAETTSGVVASEAVESVPELSDTEESEEPQGPGIAAASTPKSDSKNGPRSATEESEDQTEAVSAGKLEPTVFMDEEMYGEAKQEVLEYFEDDEYPLFKDVEWFEDSEQGCTHLILVLSDDADYQDALDYGVLILKLVNDAMVNQTGAYKYSSDHYNGSYWDTWGLDITVFREKDAESPDKFLVSQIMDAASNDPIIPFILDEQSETYASFEEWNENKTETEKK